MGWSQSTTASIGTRLAFAVKSAIGTSAVPKTIQQTIHIVPTMTTVETSNLMAVQHWASRDSGSSAS